MSTLRLHFKAGERLFLNGAVLRFDRKVSIELLNDATFLLESHVMRVEDTTTPFRQLYFTVQAMMIDPGNRSAAVELFDELMRAMRANVSHFALRDCLERVEAFVRVGREYMALRCIRLVLPTEDQIMGLGAPRAPANEKLAPCNP